MTFHFIYPAHSGTPLPPAQQPRLSAGWFNCLRTEHLLRRWHRTHRTDVSRTHHAPAVRGASPEAGDPLSMLLQRHRDLRSA